MRVNIDDPTLARRIVSAIADTIKGVSLNEGQNFLQVVEAVLDTEITSIASGAQNGTQPAQNETNAAHVTQSTGDAATQATQSTSSGSSWSSAASETGAGEGRRFVPKITPDIKAWCLRTGRCWRCREKGHRAEDCPWREPRQPRRRSLRTPRQPRLFHPRFATTYITEARRDVGMIP
ncbi:MAG: hypothetical protein J3Q66DRAFT_396305 [Benniella sp.]|nr:MAG: hypothetical protein J3Q66DRAFT_396305 [Benniella sp.]